MSTFRFRAGFRAVFMLFLSVGIGLGQVADGNLVGAVLDPAGALVAGATVEAENLATGVKSTVQADAVGQYRLNNLPVGGYRLTVSANGFSKATLSPVTVDLSKTTSANVTLRIGSITETVDVVAAGSLIDATTAQISNIYATRMATDLPVASNLTGGVVNLSLLGAGVASSGGVGAGTGPSVGGQRPRNNNFTIEGTDNNRKDITGPVASIPNDAVAEFAVLQNQFSAEYGHSSGGQFNVVSQSGTNEVHGRIYEYFQNRYLNAQDEAFKRQGIRERQRFDQNLLGGTLGGPILQNKLFYFGNFDYNPIGRSSTTSAAIFAPTAAGYEALQGIPGASLNNIGVLQTYLGAAETQDGTRTAIVQGNAIPLGIMPVLAPNYLNSYRWLTSLDYNMSDRDQWRGRYISNRMNGVSTAARLPVFWTPRPITAKVATISEIHTFSPQLMNEARLSYNRYNDSQPLPNATFPGLDVFPNIGIRTDLNLQLGPNPNAPQASIQNVYQIADNLSWNKGRHDLKFGIDWRSSISSLDFIQRVRGDYQYNNLERYVLDLVPNVLAQRNTAGKPYLGNARAFYAYANDNWRMTRNLTVNLGLRWEYNGVSKSMKEFDLNSIADVPGVIAFRAPKPQMKNFAPRVGFAYSPGNSGLTSIRGGFGIAYDQIFDNIGNNVRPPQATSTVNSPVTSTPGYLAGGGIPATQLAATLTPEDARKFTSSYLPDQKLGYAINWNFGVQHGFGKDYVLDVRYLGNRGVHLLMQTQLNANTVVTPTHNLPTYMAAPSQADLDALPLTLNQLTAEKANNSPLKQYGFLSTITSYGPQGNSKYHGMAIDLTKRFSSHLTFKAGYTWSHLMDDSTMEVNFTTLSPRRPQNYQDLRSEWASSALDRRHRLTLSWMWDTPWFERHQNWFLRNLAGHYSFGGVYIAESPQYVTPQSALDANLNSDAISDRVIINANGIPGTSSNTTALLNSQGQTVAYLASNPTAQYILARPGAYANGGRNLLAAQGINNFDLSVAKNIPFGERYRVELRADFFNAFNHAQYTPGRLSNVASTQHANETFYLTPGNSFFGKWDQVYPSNARFIQLVGKFHF